MPLEGESPVEAADRGLVRLHVELEGVPVDGVDDGAHDGAGVLVYPEGGRSQGKSELRNCTRCGRSRSLSRGLTPGVPLEVEQGYHRKGKRKDKKRELKEHCVHVQCEPGQSRRRRSMSRNERRNRSR